MGRVTIGVHVYADPRRLQATLASIAACTKIEHEVVRLIEDSAPAAFNRLARSAKTPFVVFLESGAIVSNGWLEKLLAALAADAKRGLAGPSTNRAWNAQRVFPSAREHEVARTSRDAARRFGDEVRTLEPLYSLSDFCFVVKREVIDAIGGADEAYELGPCWEMDYNLRAARSGWSAGWVMGAYVWRAPLSVRRAQDQARRFDVSRRLYQDRFCGARLRGEKHDYRAHCRGDACPNFAPEPLITIRKPLESAREPERSEILPALEAPPLVSCIMPTRNRRQFVAGSIRLFLRQDYEHRELVIVDDGDDAIADLVPSDERIRYLRCDPRLTIGAKRNLACREARGELIAHWDDDDWYPSTRLTTQVRALMHAEADVCGTSHLFFHDTSGGRAWEYRYPPASGWLAGTSLLYRRAFWARNRFIESSNGEDSAFVGARVPKRLHDLADPRLCVAMLHGRNTATRPEGSLWKRCKVDQVRALFAEDDARRARVQMPLVSCVMPTFNRRRFIRHALTCFTAQTYASRELIIVDDGDDAIEDLIPPSPHIRYYRLPRRLTLGAKRSFGAQRARGEIIAHWDDDDWYAPRRLAEQVAPIAAGEADLTGYGNTLVFDVVSARFLTLQPQLHRRAFRGDVPAGTLVFRASILNTGVTYPEINLAEDAGFLDRALANGFRLRRVPNNDTFVYVRHRTNTWRAFAPGRFLDPRGWTETTKPEAMPAEVIELLTR